MLHQEKLPILKDLHPPICLIIFQNFNQNIKKYYHLQKKNQLLKNIKFQKFKKKFKIYKMRF